MSEKKIGIVTFAALVLVVGGVLIAHSHKSVVADNSPVVTTPRVEQGTVTPTVTPPATPPALPAEAMPPIATAIPPATQPTPTETTTPPIVSTPPPAVGPTVAENGSRYGDISPATGRPKTVEVKGYYRKDGTYVRGHYRSPPRRR